MSEATNLSFSIDPSGAKTGSAQVVRSLEDIKSRSREAAREFGAFEAALAKTAQVGVRSLQLLGAGFAGMRLAQLIKQTVELSARYNELGIGLARVAQNVNASAAQVNALEFALRKTGISAIQSRQSIMSMIQAQMDLTQATKLARVAQDAAVVGQLNSSDALQRIIYGLQTAQPEMLRTLGLTVNFEQAYAKMATQLRVTQNDLSNEQKAQARLNSVMEAGTKISGLYEASMTSASKQMRSSTRYVEDLQVRLGALFQPAYEAAVFSYVKALKLMAENVDLVVTGVAMLATALAGRQLTGALTSAVTGIAQFAKSFGPEGRAQISAFTKASADAAFVTLKQAEAERVLAADTLKSRQAEMASAKGKVDKAKATLALIAAEKQAIATEQVSAAARAQAHATLQAYTATLVKVGLLTRGVTAATTAFSGALALVGGWTGAALIAAVGAITAWSSATADAVKYLEQNTDSLGPYMDRLEEARKKVDGLTDAQRKQGEQSRKIALATALGGLDKARADVGNAYGTGLIGQVKSDFATAAVSGAGAVALEKAKQAFRDTGDIDTYIKALDGVFASYNKLTPSQKALYEGLLKNANIFKALTQLTGDLKNNLPALSTAVDNTSKAFKFSEVQGQEFLKFLSKATDSKTRLTIATKSGTKEAEIYAAAASASGKTLSEFTNDLSSSNPSIKNHAGLLLEMARAQQKTEERYGKLASGAKVTNAEIVKFTAELNKQVQAMNETRTAADEFGDQLADLQEQADKLGTRGKAALNAVRASLVAAFGRQQAQQIRESTNGLTAYLDTLTASADAGERQRRAALGGATTLRALAVAEAGVNAIREKGLTGMLAALAAATAMAGERRKQATAAAQERQQFGKTMGEQIKAMNEEALAYEKGAASVRAYTLRLKILEALRNGATPVEALSLASQWDAATSRLDKAKVKVDSFKEAMLEATRGVQRSIAGLIGDAFNGSLKDARAYGRELIGIFRDIAAQIVAAFAFKKLGIDRILEGIGKGNKLDLGSFLQGGGMLGKSSVASRALGGVAIGGTLGYAVGGSVDSRALAGFGGAATGAAAGAMLGGPVGAIAGGAAGLVGGLLGHAKRMREEQRRIEESTRQFTRSMRDFTEAFVTPLTDMEKAIRTVTESALGLAQAAAAKYSGVKIGGAEASLNPDQLRDMSATARWTASRSTGQKRQNMFAFANDLDAIAEKVSAAMQRLANEQQKLETGFNAELAARAAAAEGRTAEAEAMSEQTTRQRELDEARARGFSETTIKELERVQALEAANAALERATQLEKERMDFSTQFSELFGAVTGRTDLSAIAQADATRRSGKDTADDLLKRGVISKPLYDEFLELLNRAFEQTLESRREGYADRTADLNVRWMSALGQPGTAEDMAFALSQQREMRDAVKDTSAEGKAYVAVLEKVQAAEAKAREEAKARAEEARKLAIADATKDLEVRSLVAAGKSQEAEMLAMRLRQERELREAQKDTSKEGLAYAAALKKVQEAETAATQAAIAKANAITLKSVDQRILAASGKTYEAEEMAREIERSKELDAAATEEIKSRLRLLHSIEDEARARSLAKMNQNTFNDLMVESLQLQGRSEEAARLEFSMKQALFKEEMEQKLSLKQITQATYNLAMDVMRLREIGFVNSLAQQAATATASSAPSAFGGSFDSPTVLGDTTETRASRSISESSALYLVDYAASQVALLRRLVAAVEGGAQMTGGTMAAVSSTTNRELGRQADTTTLLVSGVVV